MTDKIFRQHLLVCSIFSSTKLTWKMKLISFASLLRLRQRKKEIVWERKQLDEEEANVDEEIASLEEQFRLTAKEERAEEDEEEEDSRAGIDVGFSDVFVEGQVENVEENSVEEEDVIEENVEEEEEVKDVGGEDMDEDLEAGASDVNEGLVEGAAEWLPLNFRYARKWLEQDGDDSDIPKKYTPCLYFFRAPHGCQREDACHWSHNEEIFGREPFAAFLENLSWERKDRKTFTCPQPPPGPYPPGPPKKHRRVKRDEEDL